MSLISDVRHIVRSLRRSPAFTIAAIATLTLGLAGVVGIIAIADMVVFRPLPYPKRERLYAVSATIPGPDGKPSPYQLSTVEYVRVKSEATSLEQVEAMTPAEMALATPSGPVTVKIALASSGYLGLFGLEPALGRPFTELEERNQVPVVVLDGGFRRRQFGNDASVIGSTIVLDNKPFVVIGVTEPGFQPQLQKADAWVPIRAVVEPGRGGGPRNLIAAARLREGVASERAAEELRAIEASIAKEFPDTHARAALVFMDMHESLYGNYRSVLTLLFAGVIVLLLIACSNVANLTLARAAERGADVALRLSLGATRWRIVRYQLVESAVLGSVAVVIGCAVAWWGVRLMLAVDPDLLPSDARDGISSTGVGAIAVIFVITSAIAGLLPAYRTASTSARSVLMHGSTRQVGRTGDRRLRSWLLGAQVMLAVVLLGAASMIAAAFHQLNLTDPGFDYRQVLTLQLAAPMRYAQPQQRAQFLARVLERVERVPGVVSAGSTQTNWRINATIAAYVVVDGYTPAPGENVLANIRHVTPGYFPTLRPTVEDGRPFDAGDAFGATPVAIVSRSFADKFWPGQNAIGRRIRRTTPNAPWLTVVGVTKDVMDNGLGADVGPTTFFPYFQQSSITARITLVVRTSGEPSTVAQEVQRAIWSVDPQQPIDGVESLSSAMARSTAQPRFRATVLAVFGMIGAVLACVGVYGVAAYASARRRREVGLRVALGADAGAVRRLLVMQSLTPVMIGAIAGVVTAAAMASRFPSIPSTEVAMGWWASGAAASLAIVALAATWLPAYRASKVSPVIALQQD
jgi:predicted permease